VLPSRRHRNVIRKQLVEPKWPVSGAPEDNKVGYDPNGQNGPWPTVDLLENPVQKGGGPRNVRGTDIKRH